MRTPILYESNVDEHRKPVHTKLEFVERYKQGEFGNRAPTWDTLEEYLASGYTGLVHIRNRVAGAQTWYDVPAVEVAARATHIVEFGVATWSNLYYSGMCPTEKTTFQGEVQRTSNGLELFYSTVPEPMRKSLAIGGKQVTGLQAKLLLEHYMDVPSYEWFNWLLQEYQDHVIEFTCLSVCWGTVPNRNTLFWEVRNY